MSKRERSDDTLKDWGEFRLLNELILPILRRGSAGEELGDDCAFLSLNTAEQQLVVTTDVGPKPLVWAIGHESYRTWGWYTVLANASDLAAAGANPLAFTTSVEAPAEMLVSNFREYFEGLDAACTAFSLKNAGGNIRVAPRFACHGTAFGTIPNSEQVGRSTCQPGDSIVSIGRNGYFISSYLKASRLGDLGQLSASERDAVLRPVPQIREMQILRKAKVLSSATDNSDGVMGSLWNIIERSNVGIELWLDDQKIPNYVHQEALQHGLDPKNLYLFWGDWQIIASVKSGRLDDFKRIIGQENINASVIGVAIHGEKGVWGIEGERRSRLRLLRNENFVDRSFNENPISHTDYLLKTSLYDTDIEAD
ncbi:thiamine-phosphate kinase [Blastopirellula sp. J2-11]|uniref:thiamine-phosphate kinase n=1 Tax=Blastopirellula sp. J2-11 TaxID=2943192 RepID=UPI0021C9DEB6|nr:thiamine-phosphate kinase [Blastopirellula sp. J2-11]UUO07858.1 thiamine-phosphate kinase [Blastopirellula sp. J2-11]